MNSQLESPPPVAQIQRFRADATEKDANFLSFRQLNKRARVRLSPQPFAAEHLPVKSNLFSVAHPKGWFAAAIQESSGFSLIFAPLADLRTAFSSSSQNDEITFTPQRTLAIAPATPTIVAFASHDSRMIVSLTNGQILIYHTAKLFTSGSDDVLPMHSFPSLTAGGPRQILPNPGDMPDLVAILREPGASQSVEILDVQKMELVGGWRSGNSPDTTPTSLSWSPKGKQLAVGLLSGDILTFSPSATGSPKLRIPPTILPSNEPQALVSTTWLSNPIFHVIYAPSSPPDAEQSHFVVTHDAKSSALSSSKFNLPIYFTPGPIPSPFTLVLRNWDPLKMILLIGDRSCADFGVIGNIGEDWHTLSLEETATPSLPLDKDGNETILLALEIDLSSTQTLRTSISGEDVELPPPPVMYAYASDGTLQGWHIVNAQGTAYPGMMPLSAVGVSPFSSSPSMVQNQSQVETSGSAFRSNTAIASRSGAFGQHSAFGQPVSSNQGSTFSGQTTSAFGQPSQTPSAFGQQSSNFAQPSTIGQSSFGQPSAFGQSTFGQPSAFAQPAFGQPSAFGQAKPITGSAFGSTSSAGLGFGAFSSEAPTKFGQTGFGFGATATTTPPTATMSTTPHPQSAPSAEDDMSMDAGSSFGGLSLGETSDSDGKSKSAFGGGIFGQQTPSPLAPPDPSANKSFGSSGFSAIKPASGFGAFGSLVQQQSSSQSPSQTSEQPKPAPASAFGKSGFDVKQTSVFGQSGFPAAAAVTAPSSGGFAAFASGGSASFGHESQSGANAKPLWSTGGGGDGAFGAGSRETTKTAFSSVGTASAFGGGSAFGNREATQSSPVMPSVTSKAFPSPSSSPEPGRSPSPIAANDSPPTSPSPFKNTSPALTTGAFGQLKTSNIGFRPASGFGAFGSDSKPGASPFLKPPSEIKPVSVFASTSPSSSPAPNAGATTPTFGASSALGSGKLAFGTTPTTPTPVKAATTTGGFSAFSGSSVGFGAPAGGSKPFADLLKGGDDAKDPEKPSSSVFSSPIAKPSGNAKVPASDENAASSFARSPATQKSPNPVFTPPTKNATDLTTPTKPVFSSFGFPSKPKDDAVPISLKESPDSGSLDNSPAKEKELSDSTSSTSTVSRADAPKSPVFSPPEKSTSDAGFTEGIKTGTVTADSTTPPPRGEGEHSDNEDRSPTDKLPPPRASISDTSYGSMSQLSQNSSFVEVSDQEDQAEESCSEHDGESEHAGDQLDDDVQSFISEGFSDDSEDHPDDDHSGHSQKSGPSLPVEPTKIPLPMTPSRSPSTTPKPEIPVIGLTPSPPSVSQRLDLPQRSPSPNVRELSTTPPGSPDKEPSPLSKSPLPAPVPVLPSASAPLGIGLGRPSTRPVRSSPLANVPLSEDGEDDEDPNTITPSKSAPPKEGSKPHPASPKPAFGLWPGPAKTGTLEDEPSGTKITRPKTPPLAPFTAPTAGFPAGLGLSTVTPPTTPSALFSPSVGKPKGSMTPVSSPSLLSAKPSASTIVPPLNRDIFGGKGLSTTPPTFAPGNLSGAKPTTSLFSSPGQGGTFDGKSSSPPSPHLFTPGAKLAAFSSPPAPTSALTWGPPEPTLEQGMQAECLHLFSSLARELEELRKLAQQASQKKTELGKPFSGSRHSGGDHTKWTLGGIGHMMKELQKDIRELKVRRDTYLKAIRELESHMLKAGTRKEEIIRFNKAKTDLEFAKMLKLRTLGPEHLETQSNLRRDINIIRDRVQKLEDHLQASKKKLAQMKTGIPGLKAPSLDTINRTYRNIDIAIEQQAQDVAKLTSKMAKLNVTTALHMPPTRDKRLPDSRRAVGVTPHVAISTAAALNAERSAQKLKLALLAVRKEPLLNIEAASALAPMVYDSPRKSKAEDRSPLLAWSLPDFNESPTHALSSRRTTGAVPKRHLPPVALKRSPASQPVAPTFDWGPLPSITPMKTISPDVRRRDGGSSDVQKPLNGSWVTDDFRKK